jgi:TPP-dependent pyruvate/acetoin dehydrogenase alpha subunit
VIDVVLPVLGLTMAEGTIVRWLKAVGEPVARDEPLLVVETDKAATEVLSPAAGVVAELLAAAGAVVPVESLIARLAPAAAGSPRPPAPGPARPAGTGTPDARPTAGDEPFQAGARPPPLPAAGDEPLPYRGQVGSGAVLGVDDRPRGVPAHPVPADGDERARALWLLRAMVRIRAFDERVVSLFAAGRIAGALHSYVGEEAVAAGVCLNLRPDDYLTSTHRGHGHLLAKGGHMSRMMAELYGRVDGYCRGKGGSMHIVDLGLGILGANGIVGAGVPIATGAGTAIQLRGGDQVVACFFGDGAANIGTFHEGVNLAATWRLPIVFVCENNLYAQFTGQSLHAATPDLFARAHGYGIPGVSVDGNDALAVAAVSAEAVARARAGQGPTLIEAKTYRWHGHAINNPASALGRPDEEIAAWRARDPIPALERTLADHRLASAAELDEIRAAAEQELEAAIAFAEASPAPSPEEALEHVYASLPDGADL